MIEPPCWRKLYRQLYHAFHWTPQQIDEIEVTRFLSALREVEHDDNEPVVRADYERLKRLARAVAPPDSPRTPDDAAQR